MVAYGEFRKPFQRDEEDQRLVFYGIRYIVDNYLSKRWTMADVDLSEKYYKTHNTAFTEFPFPKDLFTKVSFIFFFFFFFCKINECHKLK